MITQLPQLMLETFPEIHSLTDFFATFLHAVHLKSIGFEQKLILEILMYLYVWEVREFEALLFQCVRCLWSV